MTTASSFLHSSPAAVHPHEPVPFHPAFTGRSVLRRLPARAFGVIRSVDVVTRSTEASKPHGFILPDLRAALAGAARLLGSHSFRIRSCLQALTVCFFVPCRASPMRLTGIS